MYNGNDPKKNKKVSRCNSIQYFYLEKSLISRHFCIYFSQLHISKLILFLTNRIELNSESIIFMTQIFKDNLE